MAEKPLLTIDGYTLVRQLGTGGMSTVYEARDNKLHRTVAVKVLHPQFCTDQTAVERFRREALAAARIDHPNIVRVYDFRAEKRSPCIILEYVPGTDMEQVLANHKRLSFDMAANIMYAIASALAEAHEHGILHRDIKPANILLHQRGRVMLSDFGIARLMTDDRLTMPDSVAGTPSFMSPEQISGGHIGPPSDIYAWAVTFYFLISGTLPYRRKTFPDVLHEIQHGKVALDEAVLEQIPPRYCELIQRCLVVDVSKRVQDGMILKELLDAARAQYPLQSDLRQLVTGTSHQRDPEPESEMRTRVYRKKRRYLYIAGILIAGFALAAALRAWIYSQGDRASFPEKFLPVKQKTPAASIAGGEPVDSIVTPAPVSEKENIVPPKKQPVSPLSQKPRRPESPMARPVTPDSGGLFVYCTPWAQIFIDGREYGKTPMEQPVTLPCGPHAIRLYNEFCDELDTTVTVTARAVNRHRFTLRVKPAYQQ